jgi:hypothetical protein
MIIKIIILFIVLLAVCASILYVYATTNNLYYRIGTFVLGVALLYLTYTHTSEKFKFKSELESKTDCVCGLDGNCTCKNTECTCDNDDVCSCKHSRFTQ